MGFNPNRPPELIGCGVRLYRMGPDVHCGDDTQDGTVMCLNCCPPKAETIQAKDIPQQPQSQEALVFQLRILAIWANRLGLYDAADFIRSKGTDT